MRHFYILFSAIAIAYFFTACANIVPPSGGPRDESAPVVDKENSIPNKLSLTTYNRNYVLLIFDERVQVANYQKEIYTTPSLDVSKFKLEANKNTAKLYFNQPLDSNTTYTINFGKSIKDVTEGNIAEDIQIAFSTGAKIDSLFISGSVLEHTTNKPAVNTLVCLYAKNDTAKLFSQKPKYYTKTDAGGNFRLKYLKDDYYELLAFTDINQNFAYDRSKEQIAYLQQPFELDSSLANIELKLIREPDSTFKILSIAPRDNYYQITLSKGIKEDQSNYPQHLLKVNDGSKTIKLFDKNNNSDSSTISIILVDSLDNKIDSTFSVKTNTALKPTKIKREFFFDRIHDTSFFFINFNEPIVEMNDSIAFFKLKDSTFLDKTLARYEWNNGRSQLNLFHPAFKTDTIEIQFKEGLFTTISGAKSEKEKIAYLPHNSENYGAVKGSISTDKKHFYIQLIDNQNIVKSEIRNQKEYTFKDIEPGKYTIRVLIDDNNNGKIESGNFSTRTLPESIYYHKEQLEIKANWEFLDINISF